MTELAPATLQRLSYLRRAGKNRKARVEPQGPAVPVQFNPATLKISRKNNVDRGGVTTKTQKRQHPATEGSTLAFDLEFDTAEQGSAASRVSVRDWTALLRQFIEVPRDRPGDPPPAVRFRWGTLCFDGVIDQVAEDLEHFAPDGTPLRAKVAVSIAEQDFDYEATEKGAGARDAAGATEPGTTGAGPGQRGSERTDQIVRAQDGESAAQVLARVGRDPEAWRAAMSGLEGPLALPAGTPVRLGPETRGAPVVDAGPGFAAGRDVASPAALATALGEGAAPGPGDPGLLLSAAGGISAAAGAVAAAITGAAADGARAGFGVATRGGAGAVPEALPAVLPGGSTAPDPRAATYGTGVPLRDRRRPGATEVAHSLASRAARARRARPGTSSGVPWQDQGP
ncbi:CIS tube protein [Actinomycetospora lemnae]|uniref:Contractile injection system tube protein N-terminal domain-containing protein n=1 Tax=Actinomycetospora lemnae TaxID=3019891 RepID=A0ABT5SRL7_9PSEU|nr:hypothetical protein [Actinomycetospora sp. DW7H6]MDD7965483.1 hypothetical protein [Actinomycetospora sp. DW7H6]